MVPETTKHLSAVLAGQVVVASAFGSLTFTQNLETTPTSAVSLEVAGWVVGLAYFM